MSLKEIDPQSERSSASSIAERIITEAQALPSLLPLATEFLADYEALRGECAAISAEPSWVVLPVFIEASSAHAQSFPLASAHDRLLNRLTELGKQLYYEGVARALPSFLADEQAVPLLGIRIALYALAQTLSAGEIGKIVKGEKPEGFAGATFLEIADLYRELAEKAVSPGCLTPPWLRGQKMAKAKNDLCAAEDELFFALTTFSLPQEVTPASRPA